MNLRLYFTVSKPKAECNGLDIRIHVDPLYMGQKNTQKCLETNTFSSFGQLWVIQSPFRLKRVRLGKKISTDGWSFYEHSQELD